jgi:hypothetical protein
MGETVELLVVRQGHARELRPDGTIGKTSDHNYFEICTSPAIYDLVAALKRTQSLGLETARV